MNDSDKNEESLFQLLLETVPHVVWSCTCEARMELVSKQFTEYTGIPNSEALGRGYSKAVLPEDVQATIKVIKEASEKKSSFSVLQRIRRKDGVYRWNLAVGNPVFNEKGEVKKWFGTTTDIHDQKIAEDELKAVQKRFDIATISSMVGVWEYDIKNDQAWRSISHDLVHGYPGKLEDWSLEIALKHVHPADRKFFQDSMTDAITNRKNWNGEYRLIWPDQSVHWVEVRGEIVKDESGDPVKLIGTTVDITKTKMAQEETIKSEERFRLMANFVPELIWSANPDGKVDYYNDKVQQYAGAKFLDGVWQWESMVHPEDEQKTISLWQNAVSNGHMYSCEHRVKMKYGDYHWHISRAMPLHDSTGTIIKWFGAATDINELKKVQELARKTAEDLRRITDIQPTLISYVDTEQRYKFVNQTYREWFKIQDSDINGKTIKEIIGESAYQKIQPYLEKSLKGERQEIENWIPYKTGSKYVNIIYEPDVSPSGKTLGVFISVLDMTDSRMLMKNLKTSEQQFASLANSIPQLAWMADPDGSIYWYNQRWYEYTGCTRNEMLGWGWKKVHHPDYMEAVIEKYTRKFQKGEIWEDTFPLKSADGKWRWFLSRAMPIKNSEGQIVRWFGTNTDITEQKELLDSLHEEQILRDKFVSTLTHDLRTPLTAAKISAQLIKKKSEDDKISNFAFKAVESLNRADKMIQDLLDASKIRAGKGIITDFQEIDLIEVTEKTLEDLATIHGDRFKLNGPKNLQVKLSPEGMRRILENLCSNAIKYGSTYDPILVTIVAGHENLCICVQNKGNPLINVDKRKLFEPFQQGTASQIAGKIGWGIGLTIVKGVAEAHGGKVEVESDEEWTTFKVIVPLDARQTKTTSASESDHH